MSFTHIDEKGSARMVDVSQKADTVRVASAEGFVSMSPKTLQMIVNGEHHKGDVFAVARIAGIQGAKKCPDLIPLCHPLPLSKVEIHFDVDIEHSRVRVESICKLTGKTGVEMEALAAVSVACLTLFDMCKAVDKAMTIDGVKVLSKSGGKSGDWSAHD